MFYCEYCFYFIFVHRCYHYKHMMMNVIAVIIFLSFSCVVAAATITPKRKLYHVMLVTTYTVLVNCIPSLLPLFFILAIMVINTFLFHSVHIFCHQSPRKLKNTVCSVGNNVYLLHTHYFCVNTKYVYRSGLKMFLF